MVECVFRMVAAVGMNGLWMNACIFFLLVMMMNAGNWF